ncbi:hypothetical protein CK203_075761 [Vitis vinifera]|uniref:Uncharacterized protein n=1 Tax=Vitis vinifera TaxID=29760 RepID=A0A438F764_VITVI|nr:hypothetical protein CK203_075761 [Vitis vinifera]
MFLWVVHFVGSFVLIVMWGLVDQCVSDLEGLSKQGVASASRLWKMFSFETAFGKVKISCSVVLRCSHGNPVTFRFQAPIFMVVGQPHQSKEFKMASGKSYR